MNHDKHKGSAKKYTARQVKTNSDGKVVSEKLIYFKRDVHDSKLYKQSLKEPFLENTLKIYGHGNHYNLFGYQDFGGITNVLYNDSTMWKNMVNTGSALDMELHACNTGKLGDGVLTIAEDLTCNFNNLTIWAPNAYWSVNSKWSSTMTVDNKGWNVFYEGNNIGWDKIR